MPNPTETGISTRSARVSFRGAVLLGAFLLFTLELMLGRLLLPPFGSSAAVWTTSLMVWQGLLLIGYAYGARASAWIVRSPGKKPYRWVHALLLLLPMTTFPFRLSVLELSPILAITVALLLAPGVVFTVLSTTSTLSQAFLHQSALEEGKDPSFLYAWSNWGAALALLLYPFVIEPSLGLTAQLNVWYALYAVYAVLMLGCIFQAVQQDRVLGQLSPASGLATSIHAEGAERSTTPETQTGGLQMLRAGQLVSWRLLSAGANALLLAVTNTVTQDAPVPMLWVLPLLIYLLTLILAFGRKPVEEAALLRWVGLSGVGVLGALAWMLRGGGAQVGLALVHISILWAGCLLCHVNLVRQKPEQTQMLGRFYLEIALGGFLGSVGVALLIPWGFGWLASYLPDYALAMGCVVGGYVAKDFLGWKQAWKRMGVRVGVVGLGLLIGGATLALATGLERSSPASIRTFYGIHRVREVAGQRQLLHGNTVHGIQWQSAERALEPTAYFHRGSPVGVALTSRIRRDQVALVGLGIGTLMAYARTGETWEAYELDGEVERLARTWFSFIGKAAVPLAVHLGDARQQLQKAPDHAYDVIVMDTFSSDAIPMHLLTREALQLYLKKLKTEGVILFHVSSRLFELRPVLRAHAYDQGLFWAEGDDGNLRRGNDALQTGIFPSTWVALSRAQNTLDLLLESPLWVPGNPTIQGRTRTPWTDDSQGLLEVIR